jgi:hypothetical protein
MMNPSLFPPSMPFEGKAGTFLGDSDEWSALGGETVAGRSRQDEER